MSKRNRRVEKRMKIERREKAAQREASQLLKASSGPEIKLSKNRQRQAEQAGQPRQPLTLTDMQSMGLPDTGMAAAFRRAGV